MIRKICLWICITFFFIVMTGCLVKKGTYLRKVEESDDLNKTVSSLIKEIEDITAEKEDLAAEVVRLQSEREQLRENIESSENKIKNIKKENEKIVAINGEKTREINELWDRIAATEKEKIQIQKSKKDEVEKVSKTYGDMLNQMKAEIEKGQITITELKGKLTVNMLDAILFDSGQSDIRSEGLEVLQKVVDVLKQAKDKDIRVEGHTDNVKIIGALSRKYPTNWELSAARAINVTKYLHNHGIDPAILSATAFGEHKPVTSNDSDEGRAQNRRIEIILVPRD
ncbi:MAG: OmpA family protein [bacterium]